MNESNIRLIVILAHMDYRDALVHVILRAIRTKKSGQPNLPVIFVTGHTHIRRSTQLDEFAFSFETGKFMDTVGVLSFPTASTSQDKIAVGEFFRHEYLDANQETLFRFIGTEEETPKALEIRKRLRQVRAQLQLDKVVGYSPFTYSIEVGLDNPLSLIRYWVDTVVEEKLLDRETRCKGFFVGGSGSIRYNLLEGPIVTDDIWAMAPFQEGYRVVRCVPGNILKQTIARLPSEEILLSPSHNIRRPFHPSLPLFVHSALSHISNSRSYDFVFGIYEAQIVLDYLNRNDEHREFQDEAFRENELNGHNLWVKYFSSKPFAVGEQSKDFVEANELNVAEI